MWDRVTYSSAYIFHLNKTEERKTLASSGTSVPWVGCGEWLAMTNLTSEVAGQPRIEFMKCWVHSWQKISSKIQTHVCSYRMGSSCSTVDINMRCWKAGGAGSGFPGTIISSEWSVQRSRVPQDWSAEKDGGHWWPPGWGRRKACWKELFTLAISGILPLAVEGEGYIEVIHFCPVCR